MQEMTKFRLENIVKPDFTFGSDKNKKEVEMKENANAWNVTKSNGI